VPVSLPCNACGAAVEAKVTMKSPDQSGVTYTQCDACKAWLEIRWSVEWGRPERNRTVNLNQPFLYLTPVLVFLAACEDEGNRGDDNLLTGGSLALIAVIIIAVILARRRRK
jgi:hypothetical protein